MKKLLAALTIGLAVLLLGFQAANSAQPATTVHITDFAFKPDALTVHVGDTVVFQNDDSVTHNVMGDGLNSGDIEGGKSWTYTFSKSGTYTYVCTYHDGMKGSVTVTGSTDSP